MGPAGVAGAGGVAVTVAVAVTVTVTVGAGEVAGPLAPALAPHPVSAKASTAAPATPQLVFMG